MNNCVARGEKYFYMGAGGCKVHDDARQYIDREKDSLKELCLAFVGVSG